MTQRILMLIFSCKHSTKTFNAFQKCYINSLLLSEWFIVFYLQMWTTVTWNEANYFENVSWGMVWITWYFTLDTAYCGPWKAEDGAVWPTSVYWAPLCLRSITAPMNTAQTKTNLCPASIGSLRAADSYLKKSWSHYLVRRSQWWYEIKIKTQNSVVC